MSDTKLTGLQYFDPKQDHTIAYKRLPHWAQAGTVCFITWRTADSLPKEAIARLNRKRQEIFKHRQKLPLAESTRRKVVVGGRKLLKSRSRRNCLWPTRLASPPGRIRRLGSLKGRSS